MQPLVLASGNAGKLRELSVLLADKSFSLITQASLGIAACPEPHHTFIENALEKARHAAKHSGYPALADDSGICVPALGGAPGVLSARYAQSLISLPTVFSIPTLTSILTPTPTPTPTPTLTIRSEAAPVDALSSIDQQNNLALLSQLGRPLTPAYYYCVLVFVRFANDPQPIIAQGDWQGAVIHEARGAGGFGYDPYFYVASENQTVAQMSAEKKNHLSHRAKALRALLALL